MECKVIQEDIQAVLDLGGEGIVFGALTKENKVDETILQNLLKTFPYIDITFHRAFDETFDLIEAYKTLMNYPIRRILTSGGAENCVEGKNKLRELVQLSKEMDGPSIMPGAGLTADNITEIHEHVQSEEYHFGKAVRHGASFQKDFSQEVMQRLMDWKK